jgi:hypothetical protein
MGVIITIVIMRVRKTEEFNVPIISMGQSLALSLGITGHQGLITCCSPLVIISILVSIECSYSPRWCCAISPSSPASGGSSLAVFIFCNGNRLFGVPGSSPQEIPIREIRCFRSKFSITSRRSLHERYSGATCVLLCEKRYS